MTDKDFNSPDRQLLTEIGPRFVLDPIKILSGSFGGLTIYKNPHYVTPAKVSIDTNESISILDEGCGGCTF